VLVNAASLWRCRFIKGTELVRREDGALVDAIESPPWTYVTVEGERRRQIQVAPQRRRRPGPPGPRWAERDYDDGTWGLYAGPFCGSGAHEHRYRRLCPRTRQVFLRARFRVRDPASVGDLGLSLRFEGGVAVYLNGVEIARAHLPEGPIGPHTPAGDYPRALYVTEKDVVLSGRDSAEYPDRFRQRVRAISAVKVPASLLRSGVNVLAVRLHCAPAAEVMFTGKLSPHGPKWVLWPRVGLEELTLWAQPGAPVVPNAPGAAPPAGFRAWNHPVVRELSVGDRPDRFEPLRPVRIAGTRGGLFSGQVVVSCGQPIRKLRAVPGDLRALGGATIPASAVLVRYGLPDSSPRRRRGPAWFDTLLRRPPEEVLVYQETDDGKAVRTYSAIQPIWITVRIPADAAPGDYEGKVTVRADGHAPVEVPVQLSVAGWPLPVPKDFVTYMGFVQSPDSLAAHYRVEPWSPQHWRLIGRSFELIGQISGKALYIPLLAKTHFGNAHSMVRWIRKPDGSYSHDFSIIDKYVDTAVRHLGRISVVCAYSWEPADMSGHYNHNRFLGDRKILFSQRDGASGPLRVAEGPKWGTPACREFWRPVMAGLKDILARRGLAGRLMIGLCGDYEPSQGAVDDLTAAAPDLPWVVHSHTGGWLGRGVRGRPVGYLACIWGMSGVSDPDVPYVWSDQRRFYGWKHPVLLARFGRNDFWQSSPVSFYRAYPEGWIVARGKYRGGGAKGFCGSDGVGRMGADFWPVVRDRRGRVRGSLAGRYSRWGGLDLESYGVTYVLGPGPDGPAPTVRFEMFRECLQENEARIFLEKILTDPDRCARLGAKLARRAQDILDERVRAFLDFDIAYQGTRDARWYVCSQWQARSARLYAVAAEAARALKTIQPTDQTGRR
jgi:hypothetical protein